MSSSSVFISRLRGLPVLDSAGDQVGRVRDVVVQAVVASRPPVVRGMVVELFGRQRIFVPMVRIHSVDAQQVIIAGVVDMRRFEKRAHEVLVIDGMIGRQVSERDGTRASVYDIAMRRVRQDLWQLAEVAVQQQPSRPFGRKGPTKVLPWGEVAPSQLVTGQTDDAQLLAQMEDMNAADIARELHDLEPARLTAVAEQLDDDVLADALGELPEDEQVSLISQLDTERAADVLEEMDPDDAADLIADLAPEKAEELLQLMEPGDAEDVRVLLAYEESTAGGMMTPEPIILAPDATVADALAHVRNPDLSPALASTVFVTRSPQEAPTGRFLGGVHFQRLLRYPPSTLVSALLDDQLEPVPPDASIAAVSRYFATYNLVVAPVVDADTRLLGAVTVDDVLDHMLPDDWRGQQMDNLSGDFDA